LTNIIDKIIGANIRRRREELSLTTKQFCAMVGISEEALAAYETGDERVSARMMAVLIKALDIPLEYLYRDNGAQGPHSS